MGLRQILERRATLVRRDPRAEPLAALLDTRLQNLSEPLAVDSAIVGRIYLVADEGQARAVRARGGVPYTLPR